MNDFKFKKKYGQNFLRDENILNKIVESIQVKQNDLIIEVGPGDGALSKKLKNLNTQILAYEIDETLKPKLELLKSPKFDYLIADFLNCNLDNDLAKYSYDKLIMIANLPYYITTPILEKVINFGKFQSVIVMVQDEVAKRLCAEHGSKDYGAFTVLLDYYFEREYLFFVDRESFYPIPNVDSAVIKLTKKETNNIDFNKFKKFIFNCFQFKRKNLKNNLKSYDLDILENILKKYNLDLNNRAEEVPLSCFIEMFNVLYC